MRFSRSGRRCSAGRIAAASADTEVLIDALCGSPVPLARARRSSAPGASPEPGPGAPGAGEDAAGTGFTPRQREVLALLAAGATNAEIADRLTVAETTVKSHVKHILRRMGAANRAEAIARHLRATRTDAALR